MGDEFAYFDVAIILCAKYRRAYLSPADCVNQVAFHSDTCRRLLRKVPEMDVAANCAVQPEGQPGHIGASQW